MRRSQHMPLYFFHVTGTDEVDDPSGLTLQDDCEARDEAVAMAADLDKHPVKSGRWRIVVVDAGGEQITQIPIFRRARG